MRNRNLFLASVLILSAVPALAGDQTKNKTNVGLFVNTSFAETDYSSFNSLMNVNWQEPRVNDILNLEVRFSPDNGKPSAFGGVIAERLRFSDTPNTVTYSDASSRQFGRSGEFLFLGGTLGYNFTGSRSRVQPYVAVAFGPLRLNRVYTESEPGTGRIVDRYNKVNWGLGGALAAGTNVRIASGLVATVTARFIGDLNYTAGLGWRF